MARIGLDFELVDLDGSAFPAARLLGRPTILVLLRHLGCLFCQEHLRGLRVHDEEIKRAGGRVAVISFAPPAHLARFADALGHPYLWLSDPQRAGYRALRVVHGGRLSPFSPTDFWVNFTWLLRGNPWIPQQGDIWQLGADFVFDRAATLTLAYRCKSSHDRPSPATVIEAFRKAAT